MKEKEEISKGRDNPHADSGQRSGSLITRLKHFHRGLDAAFAFFSAVMILIMTLLGTVDILGRRFFNSPLQGSYELMRFMMGGIAFFTFAYVQLKREHISVPVLAERLSGKGAAAFDIFCLLLMLIVSTCIGWYGGIDAVVSWKAGDVTMGTVELPLGPAKMVVPVGCGLLSLRLLFQIFESIAALFRPYKGQEDQPAEASS
jgi:TRAP-type C4-dicarboxylate transport system permease small subunit